MNRNMMTSLILWIHIFVLPTLTKSQASNNYQDAVHLDVAQKLKNEVSAGNIPNHQHQTGGPGASRRLVAVNCHPDSWEIVVQADLFNTGLMVEGRHLRLGVEQRRDPSACRAAPSGPTEFTFRAQLLDCGTVKLPPTEENIIYSNVLIYSPEPSPDGLLRLDGATIPVECHYNKFYSVNTLTLLPTWASFVLRTIAESRIDFNLKLMTGDWRHERESHMYNVGDPVHFEVSSILGNHKPLRVFVNHCVATSPDPEAALLYDFIDRGCLADAYLTNSSARFRSRTEDHRIQFHLDAFTFHQENANQIYITCHLSAVPSLFNDESKRRACSLIANRWRSVDGDDEDCMSCAFPYPLEESHTRASSTALNSAKSAQPITSRVLVRDTPKQRPYQNVHATHQSSAGLRRKGEKRKETLRLGPLIVLQTPRTPISTRQRDHVTPES